MTPSLTPAEQARLQAAHTLLARKPLNRHLAAKLDVVRERVRRAAA